MLQTRSSILLVAQVNTVAGGSIVQISNSGGLFAMQSGAWNVSIINSSGWIFNQANTGGQVTIGAGGALIGTINTISIGAGANVTVTNSGGLFSMQSGAWSVGITNSAGWIFAQSNTDNQGVIIKNSGGLFAQQSGAWAITINNTGGTALSQTLANTAGWVVAVSNTAGWIVTIDNTGGTKASQTIANTAGWVIAQSNTNGLVTTYDTNKVYDGTTSTVMKYASITVTGSGNTKLVNAVSAQRIRIISMMLISNGTGTVFLQSDSTSATNISGPIFLAANVGFVLPFHQNGWGQTGTAMMLNLSSSTINSMGGLLTYLTTS